MSNKLVIFGTTDFAQVACVYFSKDSDYEVVAFSVHSHYLDRPELLGIPVVPFEDLTTSHPPGDFSMFVAMGFKDVNRARAGIYQECKAKGYKLATYVNSKAIQWGDNPIGDNTFILEANVIQPFVKIGSNCMIWSGNHIGHHSVIGDHVFIASHVVISGNVHIGDYCFLGVNATFRDSISVAPGSVIGAGATILKDIREPAVYAAVHTEASTIPFDKLKGF